MVKISRAAETADDRVESPEFQDANERIRANPIQLLTVSFR